jgi:hypothetical protein
MKKLLLIAILFASCQKRDNLQKNLFTFFSQNLKEADSTVHLDSVRIIKFDTVTENTILYKKIMNLYDNIDQNQAKFNDLLDAQKSDAQMIRLTRGLDNTLFQNSVDEYKTKMNKMKLIKDENDNLSRKADSLSKILETSDSTTLLFLQVRCIIQYRRKDLSIRRDTGFAFLNPQKDIVRIEDILR